MGFQISKQTPSTQGPGLRQQCQEAEKAAEPIPEKSWEVQLKLGRWAAGSCGSLKRVSQPAVCLVNFGNL